MVSRTNAFITVVLQYVTYNSTSFQLILKRSKHSNELSPVQSVEGLEESIQNMMEDLSYMFEEKKSRELSKDEIEF